MHLVLHRLEEQQRRVGLRVVVDAGGVDVEHLPPEDSLAATDVADAGEQFLEVVAASGPLEPLVIHREALDEVFAQPLGRPDAELRAAKRADAVADGQYGVKVIVIHVAGNFAISLGLNYPEFPDSCLRIKFPFVIDIDQMLVCGLHSDLKQVGDQPSAAARPSHAPMRTSIRVCPSSVW